MPINFIPNDPLSVDAVPLRQIVPRPDRPASDAGFSLSTPVPEGIFAPGTPEFLFWQCREAALLSLEVWERLNGALTEWSPQAFDRKRLQLLHDAGDDLNAYYDRQSLSFFHHATNGHTTSCGASTDIVSHEAGHAFLDAIRPDLFNSAVPELAAFHEAFGDCMAIQVAIEDGETREVLLRQTPDLSGANFVEKIGEDASDGVKRALGPADASSQPRSALNAFTFQLPTSLPTTGPPPMLTADAHSFSRVFSGCFYDLIRNIFRAAPTRDADALLAASRIAGKLLITGARTAQPNARFFQAVGRAMVLSDDALNAGANRSAIGEAFANHGVLLGSSSALMPKFGLAGGAPDMGSASAGLLSRSTLTDIRRRMNVMPRGRVGIREIVLGATRFVEAVHQRSVDLTGIAKELKGVLAMAPEALIIGASGGAAAAFNALPDPDATADEVATFVFTLLQRELIEGLARSPAAPLMPTHTIKTVGGQKVLTRVRFSCAQASVISS